MIQLTITRDELNKLERTIKKYGQGVNDAIVKEVTTAGYEIQANAQQGTPRDTTNLFSNYRVHIDKARLSAEVFNDVEYMPYVEFGTGTKVASYPWFSKFEGLREQAMKFKGAGIRKINREGKGMLYSAAFRQIPKFQNAIQNLLKKQWHT